MGKIRRVHALTNTASGAAGEARVAAELARCGIMTAKPYWNDDEVDLLVLWRDGQALFPVPVQVKSIQRLQDKGKHDYISGLKKRYVEGLPSLCLAIYNPASDRIWFVDTAEQIREVYEKQASWHKHVPYADLTRDDDVRIGLDLTGEQCWLDDDWLVPQDDASWLSRRVHRATKPLRQIKALEAVLTEMFGAADSDDVLSSGDQEDGDGNG